MVIVSPFLSTITLNVNGVSYLNKPGCCWWDASIGWKVKENFEIWGSFSAKGQVALYLELPMTLYVHWLARILMDPYQELKSGLWVHYDISAPLCAHDLFGGRLYVLREQEQSVDHLWTVWFDWLVDCFTFQQLIRLSGNSQLSKEWLFTWKIVLSLVRKYINNYLVYGFSVSHKKKRLELLNINDDNTHAKMKAYIG